MWGLAGGFHSHQDNLKYKWTVSRNELQDVYFRITKAQDGGIAATGGVGWASSANLPAELLKNTTVLGNFSLSLWQHNTLLVSASTVVGSPDKLSLFGHNNSVANVGADPWSSHTLDGSGGTNIELVSFTIAINCTASGVTERRVLGDEGSILGP